MTISNKPNMLFQAEYFLRTLRKFHKYPVTIIITGGSTEVDYDFKPYSTSNPYINRCAEVLFCKTSHTLHPPVRWFVKPQAEQCVLVDSDVLVCSSIPQIENKFHGVIAHKSPCTAQGWTLLAKRFGLQLNLDHFSSFHWEKCPYYVNFGVLFVPSDKLMIIGEYLHSEMQRVWRALREIGGDTYYVSQVTLSLALSALQIDKSTLPLRYNYPDYPVYDLRYPDELNNIVFYHYLALKSNIYDKRTLDHFLKVKSKIKNHAIAQQALNVHKKMFV